MSQVVDQVTVTAVPRPNNGMQRTALPAAADAERWASHFLSAVEEVVILCGTR